MKERQHGKIFATLFRVPRPHFVWPGKNLQLRPSFWLGSRRVRRATSAVAALVGYHVRTTLGRVKIFTTFSRVPRLRCALPGKNLRYALPGATSSLRSAG